MRRVAMTLTMTPAMKDALDARVREGRAKGFPVERASLATSLLATALDVDGLGEGEPKRVVLALKALLGELAPFVPGLPGRVEAALRGAKVAENRIEFMLRMLGMTETDDGK